MTNSNLWYVRRADRVSGPFPAGLISRYILLGRIHADDELSQDRDEWRKALDCDELVPEVMKADLSDTQARERLEAARRWADERGPEAATDEAPERRSQPGTRRPAHADQAAAPDALQRGPRYGWQLIGVLAVLGAIVALAVLYTPEQVVSFAQCDAPASPGVNWSNCRLQGVQLVRQDMSQAKLHSTDLSGASLYGSTLDGAELNYANLSLADLRNASLVRASLVGANLRRARLGNTDFSKADLSYADFSEAQLDGARFDDAKLDNAIWTDRTICLPQSIGRCLRPES